MKSIAGDPDKAAQLGQAGISEQQIKDMKDHGRVPDGYSVHHKVPIDGGGSNDVSNLVLMKRDPYHYAITNAQRELTHGMKPGESRNIYFPVPEGFLYAPASSE